MYPKLRIFLFSMALVLILGLSNTDRSFVVLAQSGSTTSSISGSVLDEQGAAISGVNIKATNISTNLTREVLSDENGTYSLRELAPGKYKLEVMADGFTSNTLILELDLGTTSKIDIPLKVAAGTQEIVEVIASSLIQEGKTEGSTSQDRGRIENLPINRRNFLDFALTSPRLTSDRVPQQGVASSSQISVNGQSARFNSINIDGLDNNDSGSGAVRSTFSQDAVQEFQIISDNYSAEFGRAFGGIINIITRGGGNDFHGTGFFFLRNDETSARDVFASFEPEYKQYQGGITLSGPIKKDKAFFFTSFERLSVKQNNIVTISDSTISSIRKQGFNVSNGPIPFGLNTATVLARADLRLSQNDTLWVRYNGGFTYDGNFEPFAGLVSDTGGGIQRLEDNILALNNTYINSSLNLVNETRFLYANRDQKVLPISNDPFVQVFAPEGNVLFGQSVLIPQIRNQDFFQIVDNVSLTAGKHEFKFGGDILYASTDVSIPIVFGGQAVFTPLDFSALFGIPNLPFFTALEALDPSRRSPGQLAFLTIASAQLPLIAPGFPANVPLAQLSIPLVYAQGFGNPFIPLKSTSVSFFAQDNIKLRSNLLVKAGIRYDLFRYDGIPDNSGNFSPRIAFSYSPKRLKNTNIHGAYGIFFGSPLVGAGFAEEAFKSSQQTLAIVPLPFSILPFALPGRKFPNSSAPPPGVFVPQLSQQIRVQPELRNSYTQQANFGIDYFIKNNTAISLSYTYIRGVKLFSTRDINPVVRPTGNPVTSQLVGRVDPNRGTIFEQGSAYDSYYNAFTVSLTRKFANKFGFLAHYTFSKGIDNTIDFRINTVELNDPLNLVGERGLSLQDARSRFVASGTWDLNYTKNPILRDFQISTIASLNSGRPYNLLAGVDLNGTGDFPAGDRPLGIARNAGITPGFASVDMRITRSISFKERYRISAVIEFFNLFNRVNIDPNNINRTYLPDLTGNFNLPAQDNGRFILTKDRFRNALAPRQVQFGFKVAF